METPVPGPVLVGGDVSADVEDVVGGEGQVDQNQRVGQETPVVRRH